MAQPDYIEQQLDDILEKHVMSNNKLLELIKKERHCIIHNELEALAEINEEKLAFKNAIAEIEKERMALMDSFRARYDLEAKTTRLKDLIGVVEEPFKTGYEQKRKKLKSLLRMIKISHEGNKKLIQKSLCFHEKSFMLLFGLTKEKVGYAPSGEIVHNQKRLIDNVV
ncbi:MAG: flagellar protein FlgN [Candidatus Omnitrophica bacterium]|nr:flagellar protein FlgN [Candidatus Omnitrophota bacterium]